MRGQIYPGSVVFQGRRHEKERQHYSQSGETLISECRFICVCVCLLCVHPFPVINITRDKTRELPPQHHFHFIPVPFQDCGPKYFQPCVIP